MYPSRFLLLYFLGAPFTAPLTKTNGIIRSGRPIPAGSLPTIKAGQQQQQQRAFLSIMLKYTDTTYCTDSSRPAIYTEGAEEPYIILRAATSSFVVPDIVKHSTKLAPSIPKMEPAGRITIATVYTHQSPARVATPSVRPAPLPFHLI